MEPSVDPFAPADAPNAAADLVNPEFADLANRPATKIALGADPGRPVNAAAMMAPVVARFEGFDLLDQPRVSGVPACPGEVLTARSAVPLRLAQIGQPVVLLFENGEPRLPLIMGVLGPAAEADAPMAAPAVHVDGERQVIEAEREILLKCGDASITLTRAGKVIIKGRYVLSRSSGVNKIKGAAVDIN